MLNNYVLFQISHQTYKSDCFSHSRKVTSQWTYTSIKYNIYIYIQCNQTLKLLKKKKQTIHSSSEKNTLSHTQKTSDPSRLKCNSFTADTRTLPAVATHRECVKKWRGRVRCSDEQLPGGRSAGRISAGVAARGRWTWWATGPVISCGQLAGPHRHV